MLVDDDEQPLKYYNAIDDCIAQSAAIFGGGVAGWYDLNLPDLIRWTNRAILINKADSDE